MAEDGHTPAPGSRPLRTWTLVSLTVSTVRRNVRSLGRAAAVPIALIFVITQGLSWLGVSAAVENTAAASGLYVVALGSVILHGLLVIAFAVVCHRRVLLGIGPSSVLGIGFGRNEIRYFIYSIFLGLISLLPVLIVGLGVLLLERSQPGESGNPAVAALLAMGALAFIAIFIRGGLGLPAMALGQPEDCLKRFRIAWRQTKGSSVRLFFAMFIINLFVGFLIVVAAIVPAIIGTFWGAESLSILVQLMADFLSAAFVATLLSLAYRQLGDDFPAV